MKYDQPRGLFRFGVDFPFITTRVARFFFHRYQDSGYIGVWIGATFISFQKSNTM